MPKKQFLVIGAGVFGRAVASALFEQGNEVVVVDRDEERIDLVKEHVTHALIADASEEETMADVGVGNFDAVIVAIGRDLESSILATTAAVSQGAQRVISKATSDLSARVLRRVGAERVIRPEREIGERLARQLTTPDLVDAFELGDDHAVIEVDATDRICAPLQELRLPNRFGVQVIAVQRGGEITVTPRADFVVESGDHLVVIGSNDGIEEFRAFLSD